SWDLQPRGALYQNCVTRKSVPSGSFPTPCHRSRRIADPLAPRPRVEPRAGEPRGFEREQVVAGRDAGAAHRNQRLWRALAQRTGPAPAQLGRGKEAPVRIKIARERMVARAGDVARDLYLCTHPPAPERGAESCDRRQRMAARERGARSGQVTIQMGVQRVWNVSGGPGERAPLRARELETAVDDHPVGIGEMRAEGRWLDQRRRHGGTVLMP